MNIKRKLFNPYNKIFEVCFEDGESVMGTYEMSSVETKDDEGVFSISFGVNVFCDETLNTSQPHRYAARHAIKDHILSKLQNKVLSEF